MVFHTVVKSLTKLTTSSSPANNGHHALLSVLNPQTDNVFASTGVSQSTNASAVYCWVTHDSPALSFFKLSLPWTLFLFADLHWLVPSIVVWSPLLHTWLASNSAAFNPLEAPVTVWVNSSPFASVPQATQVAAAAVPSVTFSIQVLLNPHSSIVVHAALSSVWTVQTGESPVLQ